MPGTPVAVTDDAALLASCAAGDMQAFETFMRRHQPGIARYLQHYAGTADVDDALQETFIAAWRGAGGFRGTGDARAWLTTIARHTVHHQRRLRVDEPAQLESLEALAAQGGWGCLAAADAAADAVFDESDRRELLHRALALLPVEEREVLVLRELDGFSGDEAAAIMQCSLAAMKSRLHRARLHLTALVRRLAPSGEAAPSLSPGTPGDAT